MSNSTDSKYRLVESLNTANKDLNFTQWNRQVKQPVLICLQWRREAIPLLKKEEEMRPIKYHTYRNTFIKLIFERCEWF